MVCSTLTKVSSLQQSQDRHISAIVFKFGGCAAGKFVGLEPHDLMRQGDKFEDPSSKFYEVDACN